MYMVLMLIDNVTETIAYYVINRETKAEHSRWGNRISAHAECTKLNTMKVAK